MRSAANKNKARKTKMRGRTKREQQRRYGIESTEKCADSIKTHNKEQHTCTITDKIKFKIFIQDMFKQDEEREPN